MERFGTVFECMSDLDARGIFVPPSLVTDVMHEVGDNSAQ